MGNITIFVMEAGELIYLHADNGKVMYRLTAESLDEEKEDTSFAETGKAEAREQDINAYLAQWNMAIRYNLSLAEVKEILSVCERWNLDEESMAALLRGEKTFKDVQPLSDIVEKMQRSDALEKEVLWNGINKLRKEVKKIKKHIKSSGRDKTTDADNGWQA